MLGAGQENRESNHRRTAYACNGIAWAVKEKKKLKKRNTLKEFLLKIYIS